MAPGFRKVLRYLRTGRKLSVSAQRGSVLVAVLVAMAALTILGTTLSTVAFNDQTQTLRQQKNNEAYYLARSGAEAVEAFLLKNIKDVSCYFGKTSESEIGSGRFAVEVQDGGDGKVVISSTGYSGKYSERVTLTITLLQGEGDEGSTVLLPEFDLAVFSTGNIEMPWGSATINGDVGTNADMSGIIIGGGCRINGERYTSLNRQYPLPVFPEFPADLPFRGSKTVNWQGYNIDQSGEYSEISVTGVLTIDVGSQDLIIVANRFTVTGGGSVVINRSGSGRLILYVNESFRPEALFNEGGDPDALFIYYKGTTNNLKLSNYARLPAYFFAEQAMLTMGAGCGLYGTIITLGKSVEIKGGSIGEVQVVYAPNAKVEVTEGGMLLGAIVCNAFKATGGSEVKFDSRVNQIWEKVPGIEFDFGAEPVTDPEPGQVTNYERVWSR